MSSASSQLPPATSRNSIQSTKGHSSAQDPLSHPFHHLIPDCLSIIFTYYIQKADKPVGKYSHQELQFFCQFIRCWDFCGEVDVKEFLKRTMGEKPSLYYADVTYNTLDNETFLYFRGIQELVIDMTLEFDETYDSDAFTHLTGIVALSMNEVDHISSEALAKLTSLKHLDIRSCDQFNGDIFNHLQRLESLHISHPNNFHHSGLETLGRLRSLTIIGCRGLAFPSGCKFLRDLKELRAEEIELSPEIFENLGEIEVLHCDGLSDESVVHLKNIKEISANNCHDLTGKGLENLRGVSTVKLHGFHPHNIGDRDMKNLVGAREIHLSSGLPLTDESLQYFAEARRLLLHGMDLLTGTGFMHLKNVTFLDVSGCTNLKDTHFQHLHHLEMLVIKHCTQITDEAFHPLRNLKYLDAYGCICLTARVFDFLKGVEILSLKETAFVLAEKDVAKILECRLLRSFIVSKDFFPNAVTRRSVAKLVCTNGGTLLVF
mmetsp:Transcript_361/g.1354  ORF Transcript_361/g.1354 Transcript_361/m.1354 type:complete len:489 (-) Transcript_361:916-2382(-)